MNILNYSDVMNLPITDIRHVVKEINWLRKYREFSRKEQQRRSKYMQKYMKKYRERNNGQQQNTTTRANGRSTAQARLPEG